MVDTGLGVGTRTREAVAATAAALAFTLGLAATANAASIAYIGSDGNAYLASPDGAQRAQLTQNGAADNRYKMAGQTDAGTVVIERDDTFFWLNRDGSNKSGPWLAPKGNIGTGPLTSHVAPEGGFVVFWASNCTFACQSRFDQIVFMPEGPLASECNVNCHEGFVLPRWIPGTPFAGFINSPSLTSVFVQVANSGPQEWFGFEGENVGHFDVSRDRSTVLVETTPQSATQPGKLWLLKNNGLPPNPPPLDILCTTENFSADGNGNPRWSPDGSQIAWEQPDGVYVSPAPAANPNGCALSPRLVIPGGSSPEWGPQNVPVAGGGGAARPTVTFRFSGRLPDLLRALNRGIAVNVRSNRPGRATVQLLGSGPFARGVRVIDSATRVVGRGSKTLRRAGTARVVAKFTRKAKRRYRRLRRVKLTVRVRVRATGGGTTTKNRRIMLRHRR